jgi:hypothetical protein
LRSSLFFFGSLATTSASGTSIAAVGQPMCRAGEWRDSGVRRGAAPSRQGRGKRLDVE